LNVFGPRTCESQSCITNDASHIYVLQLAKPTQLLTAAAAAGGEVRQGPAQV
jgi:hypothetical protein